MRLEKDRNGALGISIAGGLGSPIGDRPVIIAYAQGQAAAKVAVSDINCVTDTFVCGCSPVHFNCNCATNT